MLSQMLSSVPTGVSGVYCMFDLDGDAAYAGQSSQLRRRLKQHFIRQDSSVVSYGRLDIWDIAKVDWWKSEQSDYAEKVLLSEYRPYLNFVSDQSPPTEGYEMNLSSPDGTVKLISEEERAFRSEPYNRSKQKLEHLLRMIDKIKLAGHSDDTKYTLFEHQRIFFENVSAFLGVDPLENSDVNDKMIID